MARKWLVIVLIGMSALSVSAQGYPVPSIPDSITDATERCNYATECYWDYFDFNDTTLLRTDYAEQALVNFLWLAKHASEEGRTKAVAKWVSKVKQNTAAYRYFVGKARQYLTNPDSPVYSLFPLEVIMGNRIGDKANDFSYMTVDGRRQSLDKTATDHMTLLLFYDPDCDSCRKMINRLRHDAVVNKCIAEGQLTVLAIYIEEDYERWRASAVDMPAKWVVGTERGVVSADELYDLTIMPSIYLLDSQKKIVQKDSLTAIRQWLVSK
jgi:thiol-disulfide isomerase/thioredoxin